MGKSDTTAVGVASLTSAEYDGKSAAQQLVSEALADGGFSSPDFGIFFCSTRFKLEEVAAEIDALLSGTDWVGCTTAGEITPSGSTAGGAVLLLIRSDDMVFETAVVKDAYQQPVDAGEQAAREVLPSRVPGEPERNTTLFALMPGHTQQETGTVYDILGGIMMVAGRKYNIVGGASGDDFRFTATYQFHNGTVYEDAVILTRMVSGQPVIVGKPKNVTERVASGTVTETQDNIIQKINNQSAARFYGKAVGATPADLRKPYELPIKADMKKEYQRFYLKLMKHNPYQPQQVFRYALEYPFVDVVVPGTRRRIMPYRVTREAGLVVPTEVPATRQVHIRHESRREAINEGKKAFADAEQPLFAIVTGSAMRYHLLSKKERRLAFLLLKEQLDCPIVGFYSYSQIGCMAGEKCINTQHTYTGFALTSDR